MITLSPCETRPVAPHTSTAAAPAPAALTPVPGRAAAAILGTMILLILMLTGVLVQTTRLDPAGTADRPGVESGGFAQR